MKVLNIVLKEDLQREIDTFNFYKFVQAKGLASRYVEDFCPPFMTIQLGNCNYNVLSSGKIFVLKAKTLSKGKQGLKEICVLLKEFEKQQRARK